MSDQKDKRKGMDAWSSGEAPIWESLDSRAVSSARGLQLLPQGKRPDEVPSSQCSLYPPTVLTQSECRGAHFVFLSNKQIDIFKEA